MNKTVKGALAAATAAVLLLGGAGTLAYWSDTQDVGGGNITSGSVTLTAPDCTADADAGTHGWQLDGGTPFVPGSTDLVPGDSISKVCNMTLTLAGEHVGATLAMDAAGLTAGTADTSTLATELVPVADFTVDDGTYAPITAPGPHNVQAVVTVTFNGLDATNASQVGDVDLDAIKLVATQTHS